MCIAVPLCQFLVSLASCVPTKFTQVTATVCMSDSSAECHLLHDCRRQELSYECKATLFDQEVRMAENIDFQFPMKKACSQDIQVDFIWLSGRGPCADDKRVPKT